MTVTTPQKLVAGALRRGFHEDAIRINREDAILGPVPMREVLSEKYRSAMDELRELRVKMGYAGTQNINKWRGRERSHPKRKLITKYFELADEAEGLAARIRKINQFMKDHRVNKGKVMQDHLVDYLREMVTEDQWEYAIRRAKLVSGNGGIENRTVWLRFVETELDSEQ